MSNRTCLKAASCLILGLALSVWIYLPGLGGSFELDDNGTIANNNYLKISHFTFEDLWQASLSSDSGQLRRPVAMFSFAINHVLTGMDTWWMKLTNLGIHLLNGLILLLVLTLLFRRLPQNNDKYALVVPYIITITWLVHPINVTAVSYIVQRMTSLSATFVLLSLYCYLKLRERKLLDWRGYALSLSILFFWLLGLLSKESAISLSIYIFSIEWCVYGFKTDSEGEKKHLRILWSLLAAPWVCAFIYVLHEPSFVLNGYVNRDYTIVERVLTEFRIVIDYLRLIIIPDIRHLGLYHDDIIYSKSLIEPISTLLSLLMIISLLVLAIRVRKKSPLFCLGVFWFFGGHVLESTIYPLELMFLHRNYLPSIGILLAVTDIGVRLYQNNRTIVTVATVLILLSFSICTRSLAYHWSGDTGMIIIEVINNPKSVRANFRTGQLYNGIAMTSESGTERLKYRREAVKYFRSIRILNPQDITGELSILESYLRFGEPPPKILLDNLVQSISTAKIKSAATNVFTSIIQCLIKEGCFLQASEFQRLMDGLLSNPSISGRQRADLLGNYAAYVLEYENDLDKAISIVLQGIDEEPSMLELHTLLIFYYGKSGNTEDIKRALDTLDRKDRFGQYRKYIRQAREEVNASIDLPHTP